MKRVLLLAAALLLICGSAFAQDDARLSTETRSCLNCHKGLTPGIVHDWQTSRHSTTTPSEALHRPKNELRVSATGFDASLENVVVGCYECHGLNTDKHADNFRHFGYSINVIVSPNDCATCHPVETAEYSVSKKANAYGNITDNPVYHQLVDTIISPKKVTDEGDMVKEEYSSLTHDDACYACHGTKIEVDGMKTVKTQLGNTQFPNIKNWPNMGVGRINPDGSKGACTSCHPRHSFSIEIARQPQTCGQCHREPDVPAYEVYTVSKHGNIYNSHREGWDFSAVPWKLGADFKAPTCAVCHMALIAAPDGGIIAKRSHDFGARLWVRLFGLIYTAPQPKSGDTTIIKNKDGLPLPTTFTGEPASEYLISPEEQAARKEVMMTVCRGCHSSDWVNLHFAKLDNSIKESDDMVLQATKIMQEAWEDGYADASNPFNEELEQKWIKQWLFYGNTLRYASAMTGAQDYISFKYGWWGLTTNLQEMYEKLELKRHTMPIEETGHDKD